MIQIELKTVITPFLIEIQNQWLYVIKAKKATKIWQPLQYFHFIKQNK